jgi:hypothetical protein
MHKDDAERFISRADENKDLAQFVIALGRFKSKMKVTPQNAMLTE